MLQPEKEWHGLSCVEHPFLHHEKAHSKIRTCSILPSTKLPTQTPTFSYFLCSILLTHSSPSASFSHSLTYLRSTQLLQTCLHKKTDHGNSYSLTVSSEYIIHFIFSPLPIYLYTNKNNFLEKQRGYSRVSKIWNNESRIIMPQI